MYNFPVESQELLTKTGAVAPRKRAIVRTDTNKVLGVVSDKYKIISHADVIDTFNRIPILKEPVISTPKEGSILLATYDFKENGITPDVEVKKGDIVRFQARVFNSYNMDFGVGFELCARRLICLNGMTVPVGMFRVSMKHFQKSDIGTLQELLVQRLEGSKNITSIWRKWTSTSISAARAGKFIVGYKNVLGDKARDHIFQEFTRGTGNIWSLYNAFSSYLTHEMKVRNEKNESLIRRERDNQILNRFYKYNWEK